MAPRYDSLILRSRVFDATQQAQKNIFISALKRVGTVSVACELIGLNRKTLYRWREDDKDFADDWDHALTLAFEGLESATYLKLAQMLQRDYQRINSAEARLIEVLLAGAKPEKYRQRSVEIDNTQNVAISVDWSKVPDAVMQQFTAGNLTLNDVYQATLMATTPVENTETAQQKTPSEVEGV